jgi:hypothetical protein
LRGVHPEGTPAPVPVAQNGLETRIEPDWAPDGSGLAWTDEQVCAHTFGASLIGPDGRVLVRFDKDDCGFIGPDCPWYRNASPAVAPDGTMVAYVQSPSNGPAATTRIIGVDGTGDRSIAPAIGDLDWRPLQQTPRSGICDGTGVIHARHHLAIGTPGDDVICGSSRNDLLIGRGGDDVLVGGGGRDILAGGDGLDRLYGEAGRDRLYGGAGDDVLAGGPGRDRISGDAGADSLIADDDSGARDLVMCGSGADLILADVADVRRGCGS